MKLSSRTSITLCLSLVCATTLTAQAPWARVPAFPSACYSEGETFDGDVGKMVADLDAAIKKQAAINADITAKRGELDPATKQARMMAFLQKDPMNAGRYMQDMSTGGQKVNEMNKAVGEKRTALRERRKRLDAQYAEDAKRLGTPTPAQYTAAQSIADYTKLVAQANAAYSKLCAQYWTSATNPYLQYLAELKRFHLEESIPAGNEFARIEKLNFDVFGVPSAEYRSTAEQEGLKDYLEEVRSVFGGRLVRAKS